MIDREHDLPVTKQAKILRISRGSVYYRARPVSATDLEVMRRLDRLHLEFPFAGSRMLQGLLSADGCKIGRRHVKTLMRRMAATSIVMVPAGGVETGDVTVRAIVSWTSVNPLLTTFPGSHCCNPANSALSLGRIDQECAMSRPGEIAGDKLRAIVERIERIEEEIKELVEGKKEMAYMRIITDPAASGPCLSSEADQIKKTSKSEISAPAKSSDQSPASKPISLPSAMMCMANVPFIARSSVWAVNHWQARQRTNHLQVPATAR